MTTYDIENYFPNIVREGIKLYNVTSRQSTSYNCFAWAMGDTERVWDPTEIQGYFWPPNLSRSLSVTIFVELFRQTGGYQPCDSEQYESGFEKIAIYADQWGNVTHAARQLESGNWTSKLGDWEDVQHETLGALECRGYGKVTQVLRRAVVG